MTNKNLEERLCGVVEIISNKLKGGEMDSKSFSFNVLSALKDKEILYAEGFPEVRESLNYFSSLLKIKLNLRISPGIMRDYVYSSDTILSDNAQKDITKYGEMCRDIHSYLKRRVGDKRVRVDEFKKIVNKYIVDTSRSNVRVTKLVDRIAATYEKEFNVIHEPLLKLGDYRIEEIERALGSI